MERKVKFADLCIDCEFDLKNPSVCDLCFDGSNYTAKVMVGPVKITMEEYKEVFRCHRWIAMFSSSRIYDVVKRLLQEKPTYTKVSTLNKLYETLIKTRSLLHQQLYGSKQQKEEYLCETDEYYYFKYRDVMYMIHRESGKDEMYVKALLDWHEEVHFGGAV